MINHYFSYVILACIIAISPGPVAILSIKNGYEFGIKNTLGSISGNSIAMVILASLSAFGIGGLIYSSEHLFNFIKVCGCLYLIYIGIKLWIGNKKDSWSLTPSNKYKSGECKGKLFKEGFIVGISNPKALAFYIALFPQFIDVNRSVFPQYLTLILTIEGLSCLSLTLYGWGVAKIFNTYLLKNSGLYINRVSSICLIGYGIGFIIT